MKSIAIIPARSGSKGLPDKNIIDLNGKPLIYYTIKAALNSDCFEEVMVSTDSAKYAEIAKQCGASVPFFRSEQLSGDSAGTWDAVREVLTGYRKMGREFDYVAILQPTSPLRDAEDVKGLFALMKEKSANNAVSVTEVDHPVQWCFTLPDNCSMDEMAKNPYNNTRRQELATHYRENGAIYLTDAVKIMDRNYDFYGDNCVGYVMPKEKSVDIDTKFDLVIAKAYMEYEK